LTLAVPGGELRLACGGGRLTAFPFFRAGTWRQVHVQTGPDGRIRSLTLTGGEAAGFPDEGIEILEERDSLPFMARYTGADTVYFAIFQFSGRSATETWYSGEGGVLKVRSFRYEDGERRIRSVEEDGEADWNYDYDAFGNVSGVRDGSTGADFSAGYVREERPRYWKGPLSLPVFPWLDAEAESPPPEEAASGDHTGGIPPATLLSLQWDERGLLTSLNRDSGVEEGALAGVRYEYILDSQGNWTERREFFMVRRSGFLIALPGETLRRRIEYSGGNG
jgi:YD repeat-containing protein